ncbi:MAG: hypothetical protein MJZ34_06905 [Paludibacteraceae bacterium]|nr:hypothetical protein [Paludibacteraceae bacterium]
MEELLNIIRQKFEVSVVKKGEYKGCYTFTTDRQEKWYLYEDSSENGFMLVLDDDNDFFSTLETFDLNLAKKKLKKFVEHNGVYKALAYNTNTDVYDFIYE